MIWVPGLFDSLARNPKFSGNRRRRTWLLLALVLVAAGMLWVPGCVSGPRVATSLPAAGAAGLLVDTTLSFTFDRPMQLASLEAAVSFSPPLERGFSVEASADGKTIRVLPTLPLLPDTRYNVTVANTALGKDGKSLRKPWTLEFATAKPRTATCLRPCFSPDGSMLAWTEGVSGTGNWAVFAAPADGSGPARQLSDGIWPDTEVTWYPDGSALLVVVGSGETGGSKRFGQLPLADVLSPLLPLNEQLTDPGRLTASFSPSGLLLAVQNDMYLADAHSDYLRELGVTNADYVTQTDFVKFGNLLVGWGMDDTELIYLDMPGIGDAHNFNYDVYRYSPARQTSTKMPGVGKINNFGSAARSANGGWFAFYTWFAEEVATATGLDIQRLPRDLWLMDAGVTSLTRLTRDSGHNADPAFAGDGALLFASDRTGDWDIWSIPDLSTPAMVGNLTGRLGYDGQPGKSPVADMVVLVSDASGTREVWTLSQAGWRQVSGRAVTP